MSLISNLLKRERGVTRRVYLIGHLAFKFPITETWQQFLLGLLANMQEVKFGRTSWPELCPIVFFIPGGWLVVMRRARELTQAEFDSLDIASWVNRNSYLVPAELKADSFGWLDGRLVAIDYGN